MTDAERAAWLATLEAAYYSGILTVRHGETTTTYRSLDEMKQVINGLSTRTRALRYVHQSGKGL